MFKEYRLGKTQQSIDKAVQEILNDFGNVETKAESMLRFALELVPDVAEGTHTWTIRYKPTGFRYPCSDSDEKNVLPVCINVEPDPEKDQDWKAFGHITIPRMVVGHVCDWPETHRAIRGSGGSSKAAMIDSISNIYKPIYGIERIGDRDILFAYQWGNFKMTPEFVPIYKEFFA